MSPADPVYAEIKPIAARDLACRTRGGYFQQRVHLSVDFCKPTMLHIGQLILEQSVRCFSQVQGLNSLKVFNAQVKLPPE